MLNAPCSRSSSALRLLVSAEGAHQESSSYVHAFNIQLACQACARGHCVLTVGHSNALHHSWPSPGLDAASKEGNCICKSSNCPLTRCKLFRATMPQCDACVRTASPQSPGGAQGSFQTLASLRQEPSIVYAAQTDFFQ